MTSLSRKNRPTTLRRTILKATAISLAYLCCGTGAADAQAPGQGYRPIATNTTPFPATPIAQTPARPIEVPAAAAIGTRVLMPGQPANPNIVRVQWPPSVQPPALEIHAIEQLKVFRLSSDAALNGRIIDELNADNLDKFRKDMINWNIEKLKNEAMGEKAPNLPEQAKDFVLEGLPKSVGKPKQTYGAQSRQDPSPLWLKVEPSYVVHRRLMFEEKNSERYGWELGIAQPAISAAYFAKDLLLWPSHLASSLFERYDTSAGKCPPGSPVPYLLYPPEITAFGGTVGAAVIVGTAILIP